MAARVTERPTELIMHSTTNLMKLPDSSLESVLMEYELLVMVKSSIPQSETCCLKVSVIGRKQVFNICTHM